MGDFGMGSESSGAELRSAARVEHALMMSAECCKSSLVSTYFCKCSSERCLFFVQSFFIVGKTFCALNVPTCFTLDFLAPGFFTYIPFSCIRRRTYGEKK